MDAFVKYALTLSFYFAVLTYYLGCLIYALPIPSYGLKKWAPTLISDSLAALFITTLYTGILATIKWLIAFMGASWSSYIEWITLRIGIMIFVSFVIMNAGAMLSQMIGPGANALFSPLTSVTSYATLALSSIAITSIIIKTFYDKILALGILLYSLPFRVGRSIGAGLIALVVVFYTFLPLMPSFISSFTPAPSSPVIRALQEHGLSHDDVKLIDSTGRPIPGALIEFYDLNGHFIASYVTNSSGYAEISLRHNGLPATRLRLKVFYCGLELPISNRLITFKKSNRTVVHVVKTKNFYLISNYLGVIVEGAEVTAVKRINSLTTRIDLRNDDLSQAYIVVLAHSDYQLSFKYYNASLIAVRNLDNTCFKAIVFNVSSVKSSSLSITIVEKPSGNVNVYRPRPYPEVVAEALSYPDLTEIIAYLIASWIILPVAYMSILLSITYGLAYVLSGIRPRIPEFVRK